MNKNEKKESRGFFTAIYTVAAIFLIMAFAFSVLKVSNHPQENANNDIVEDSAPVDKSNVAPLTTTEATTLEETTTETTTKHMDVVQPKTAAIFDDTQEMEYPIADAKILMDYSTETAVYDNTLDQYRTNDSIAFAATLGENVVAAFDGVVTSVDKDDINGTTVTAGALHTASLRTTFRLLRGRLYTKATLSELWQNLQSTAQILDHIWILLFLKMMKV